MGAGDDEAPAGTRVPGSSARAQVRVIATTTLTMTISTLTIFLVSSHAVLIREEFGFTEVQLGFSASAFSTVAALLSVPGGAMSDRLGSRAAMRIALCFAGVGLLGIGLVARSWVHIALFLACAGAAQAFAASSTNLALVRGLPVDRAGVGFGIKSAAVPISSSIAGLSLPLVGLTFGWRYAFVGAVAILLITFIALPPSIPAPPQPEGAAPIHRGRTGVAGDIRPLLILAVAAGIGSAAGSAMMAFWVVSSIARGVSITTAGALLTAGSLLGMFARVFWGRFVDRTGALPLATASGLLFIGAVGLSILAYATTPLWIGVAMILVFGAGWSWPGLFHLAVSRRYPETPAAATGLSQLGLRVGGVIGPATFGIVVSVASYRAAWLVGAGAMVVGSMLMRIALRAFASPAAADAMTTEAGSAAGPTIP